MPRAHRATGGKKGTPKGAPSNNPRGGGAPNRYTGYPLRENEQDVMTAQLVRHLLRPGLIPACRLILKQMHDDSDVTTARVIVKLAQDLIQRGFPDIAATKRSDELLKELVAANVRDDEPTLPTPDDTFPDPDVSLLATDDLVPAPGSLPSSPNGGSP